MTQNSEPERPNTIIHLGAGTCNELDTSRTLKPEQIILVETNPEQLEALHQRVGSANYIQVIESDLLDALQDSR